MIKSMTAYGRGEYEIGNSLFTAELKSLNNRYRDIILRIPRSIQLLEDEIRSQISTRIRRGRIEISIQIEKRGEAPDYGLELNLPLVRSYLRILTQLKDEFDIDGKISPEHLYQMKDVIIMKPEEVDIGEARSGLHKLLSKTMDSLDLMRAKKGKLLKRIFKKD